MTSFFARNTKKARNTKDPIVKDDDDEVIFLEDEELEKVKYVLENGYTRKGHHHDRTFTMHQKIPQGEFFIVLLNTGLRRGEACALKYSDVNFEEGTISITKSITVEKNRDENGKALKGHRTFVDIPKTEESEATIKVPKIAIDILREMLAKEREINPKYNGYILHSTRSNAKRDENGEFEYLFPGSLNERWETVCEKAGITAKGVHVLRHTCASHLFAKTNGNSKIVSQLLRHANVAFTEQQYISILKKYRDTTIQDFEV